MSFFFSLVQICLVSYEVDELRQEIPKTGFDFSWKFNQRLSQSCIKNSFTQDFDLGYFNVGFKLFLS